MTELTSAPLTPEERAAADEWLASGGVAPLTLTPAPPGPNPGQPGHFAHHNWLETSVKSLALPAVGTTYLATGVPISATVPTALGCDVTIVNPDATRTVTCVIFGQSQMTVAAGLTAAISALVDGATTLGSGVRGEEGRAAAVTGGGTVTLFFTRTISLNPGTSRVRLAGATVSGSGSQTYSFNKLTVLPVGWI